MPAKTAAVPAVLTGIGKLLSNMAIKYPAISGAAKNVAVGTATTGGIGGTLETLQGAGDPNETRSAVRRFGEGFKAWAPFGALPTAGGAIGGSVPGGPFVKGVGRVIGQAGGLLAALPKEQDQIADGPAFGAGSYNLPQMQLPKELQDNQNLPLLHFHHMMQPQQVNFDLSDPTFNKNLKFIYTHGKQAIPTELRNTLEPIIQSINNNENVANLNLSPAQLRQMQHTLLWHTHNNPALQQHMQSKWVSDTISGIYDQLDNAAQQADNTFANTDPNAPEYQPANILQSYTLNPAEFSQLQTAQQSIIQQIEQMQATGDFTDDQISNWIQEEIPQAGEIGLKLGLHELIGQKMQMAQQGQDTTGILAQINTLLETGATNLSDPAVMQNVTEQFQQDTGMGAMVPDFLQDLYGWFMAKEGWEQAAIMTGISLGTAGLITAVFSENMLMALIMAVLGAGVTMAGIPEVRDPIVNYLGQFMGGEDMEEEV